MKTFLVSDTHFGHKNILNFLNKDGSKLRPFETLDEMHEVMIERWNSVVRPKDRIYHLGDVAIPRRGLQVLSKLNGRKILIKGNHDIFKLKDYTEFFDDIRAYWSLDGFILSHIPLHEQSVIRWKANIHGHLHSNIVNELWTELPDKRYINVSVEQINYTPIDFEEIRNRTASLVPNKS